MKLYILKMKLYIYNRRGRAGRKNAISLKETTSNEEPNAGGRKLHMLLSNETTPCSETS